MDVINLGKGDKIIIDVQSFLERYDIWDKERWTDDRLICCSPFREDNSPSFFVNYNNDWGGTWGDSGSGETGNFISLVAKLDSITYEEARQNLYDEFFIKPYDVPELMVKLPVEVLPDTFDYQIGATSPYLEGRGISIRTQNVYGVSGDESSVCFPYIDGTGNIRALKHRSTLSKDFWYNQGNNSINRLLFGYHVIYDKKPSTVFICEAEIDAMTAYEMGYVGVSTGSAHVSPNQIELLIKSGVTNFVIATDNDDVGNECAKDLTEMLGTGVSIFRTILPPKGDLNDYWRSFHKLPPIKIVRNGHALSKKLWFKQIN